jgi:putative transposase
MPRRRRPAIPGLTFHVVNRAARKARIFETSADYQAFERVLVEAVQRSDVALYAYCIMPTHWHLIIAPRGQMTLSSFMHWLTTTHARRWHLAHGTDGEGAVYQGRFKSIPVQQDGHFLWVTRYVERNALRAGLVERAETWPWSSLWQRTRDPQMGSLTTWPVPCPADWTAHVNEPQTEAELDAFRRCSARNEPYGDCEWARAVDTSVARKRGRPKK